MCVCYLLFSFSFESMLLMEDGEGLFLNKNWNK